ncbi:MAG: hypothetical protein WC604_01960 [Candidatus Gracilibacteria bacterium]
MKTFLTILLTAIVVGAGVYFWQNYQAQPSSEPSSEEASEEVAEDVPEVAVEPLLYSSEGVDVEFSKKEGTFDYTVEQLESMAAECGTVHEVGYLETLVEAYENTPKTMYKFKYNEASQENDTFIATLLPNRMEYASLDDVRKDFDQCSVGGDMYPTMMNQKWLLFVNSCGTGYSDGSGNPIGCQVVRDVVEPTLELNGGSLNEPEVSEEGNEEETNQLTKIDEDEMYVYYEGTITVSGEYRESQPHTIRGEMLCFYADEETDDLLPRASWFCFENQEAAKTTFGVDDSEIFEDPSVECFEGSAKVKVSNYKVNKKEAAVYDTAKLEKVLEMGAYSTDCE